jgi:hypothetical protein
LEAIGEIGWRDLLLAVEVAEEGGGGAVALEHVAGGAAGDEVAVGVEVEVAVDVEVGEASGRA